MPHWSKAVNAVVNDDYKCIVEKDVTLIANNVCFDFRAGQDVCQALRVFETVWAPLYNLQGVAPIAAWNGNETNEVKLEIGDSIIWVNGITCTNDNLGDVKAIISSALDLNFIVKKPAPHNTPGAVSSGGSRQR